MPEIDQKQRTYGFFAALTAFFLWGLLPIYWKSLLVVNPFEILCHRIVWSLVFLTIALTIMKGWSAAIAPMKSAKNLGILILSSFMIGTNWLIYIWAVNTNHVLETSLGYYINPLVNVLLGFLFFKERLKPLQLLAIGLAALGVVNSVISYGELPWISLVLAVSFGFYGLLRKIASVESLPGLFFETLVLAPVALGYIIKLQLEGNSALFAVSPSIDFLLIGAGAATSIPLIGFAYGARRLQLTSLGLLQYLAPTIAFCLGVFAYHEPFSMNHLITFALIWTGLAVYTTDSLWTMRKHRRHTSS